jgi:hypothetical protein
MKAAPVARRIFDHQGKTTFATQSGVKRTWRGRGAMSALMLWTAPTPRYRSAIGGCVKANGEGCKGGEATAKSGIDKLVAARKHFPRAYIGDRPEDVGSRAAFSEN